MQQFFNVDFFGALKRYYTKRKLPSNGETLLYKAQIAPNRTNLRISCGKAMIYKKSVIFI